MPDDNDRTIERIAKELKRPVSIGRAFDDRVMREVRELPRYAPATLWARLTTPRRVTITPLSWGLLAAGVLLFAALGVVHVRADVDAAAAPIEHALFPEAAKAPGAQKIQFVLVAPDARKVAVVGDFNGWDASHAAYQAQHRGGGVWAVTAPVPVGHHHYSFVVDDSLWIADPTAPRAPDTDFGVANSAIVVSEQ